MELGHPPTVKCRSPLRYLFSLPFFSSFPNGTKDTQMPKIPRPNRNTDQLDQSLQNGNPFFEEYMEFRDPSSWSPSKSNPNNIWRRFDGITVTIFLDRNEEFRYFLAYGGDSNESSKQSYDSREDAIDGAASALGLCGK